MFTLRSHPRRRRAVLITGSIAAVTAVGLVAGNAFANAAPEWKVTETPKLDQNYTLTAVTANNAKDVWAVGSTVKQAWSGTVAMHWDGNAWTQTDTPKGLALQDVATGAGADDVWAVGVGDSGALTTHWDGNAWKEVETPAPDLPAGQSPILFGVGSNYGDTWAVGCGTDEQYTAQTPYAQHWVDDKWELSEVALPEGMKGGCLDSVAVVSANQVYAVGRAFNGEAGVPFAATFDGDAWKPAELPAIEQPDAELTSVVSPSDGFAAEEGYPIAFAAGFAKDAFGDPLSSHPVMFTLDLESNKWTQVETPDTKGWIYGIGVGGDGLMMTGYRSDGTSLLLQYTDDGKVTEVDPPVTEGVSSLYGVDIDPETRATFVVGDTGAADETMQGMAAIMTP